MSQRQVGSTFKPFVYAAAMEQGLLPGTLVDDAQITRGEIRAASNWTPANSDNTYKGMLRAEEGLIQSRNTMTVRIGERVGLPAIARLAAEAGIPRYRTSRPSTSARSRRRLLKSPPHTRSSRTTEPGGSGTLSSGSTILQAR
jgi:membrane carboxypeptidase/penicillin-binding protein